MKLFRVRIGHVTASRPPHGGRGLKYQQFIGNFKGRAESPPARGAWVEIRKHDLPGDQARRRPPHGGRGLKFPCGRVGVVPNGRPPHGGRGLKLISRFTGISYVGRPPHGGRGLKSFGKGRRIILF